MDIEFYRSYCLSKNGVSEGFPFDDKVLVFKVGGKMFSLLDVESFESVNLKCDPDEALRLREEYPGVNPGYHMNKKHWNTVKADGIVPDHLILKWTDDSYELVLKSLPLKLQKEIRNSNP